MTQMAGKTVQDFCWELIFELRQPMTAISGHAQRARHLLQTDPRGACEALDVVVEQITRIDGLLVELYERERWTEETPSLRSPRGRRPEREGAKT